MNDLLKDTYYNKKVLITGHTGFKGCWLSLWLNELGADVIGYSIDPPSQPNLFDAVELKDIVTNIYGDLRDEEHLLSTFKMQKPDFVFHLAAQSLVLESYNEPKLTYDTNVIGTVNILEAARKSKNTGVFIAVTSDKCYENRGILKGYKETDRLGGNDPYSSSKACTELVVEAYRKSFFKDNCMAISSARSGNVIGGGDWGKYRLIPDCIRMLSRKKKIPIRSPHATRPWQYVLEPLSGYLLLGALMNKDRKKYSGAWNFGPKEKSISVEGLVRIIINLWGDGEYEAEQSGYPSESQTLMLDATKAKSLLGWRQIYSIQEATKRTVSWYKLFYENSGRGDIRDITMKEIKEYQALMRT
jgi:CDP-glucose 4,6-dehydratase